MITFKALHKVGKTGLNSAVLLASIFVVLALGASPASAKTPWWQLDSVSVPRNLHAGVGRNEVQKLTVAATEGFVVVVEPASLEEEEKGTGVAKVTAFEYTAKHEEVQSDLESVYGAGNVEVSGGPGDMTGGAPYLVTFKGELADQPVRLMNTAFSGFAGGLQGQATVTEVTGGRPDGQLVVTASNLGDAEVDGSSTPVVLRDRLPAGLRVRSVAGRVAAETEFFASEARGTRTVKCTTTSGSLVECTFVGKLAPYERLEVEIGVEVAGAKSGETSEVSVSGGGAPSASLQRPIVVSEAPTPFGPENYELTASNEDGSVLTQAGAHPYALTTTLDLNRTADELHQPAQPKDLRFDLPPGLLGNPAAYPQCSDAQFSNESGPGKSNQCPPDTALGVATITIYEPFTFTGEGHIGGVGTVTTPVFNLKPEVGEPARFGFVSLIAHVILDTSVRTGGDYGVTVSANNIVQTAALLSSQVTFWGVPGDPIHDSSRGWACLDGFGVCKPQEQSSPAPFLSLPTSCTGTLRSTAQGDSWTQRGVFTEPLASPEPSLDGCNRLPFEPSLKVTPDATAASSPAGLNVDVHVNQESVLSATGLAQSNVKDITVALPEGVAVNPAGGDGLAACGEGLVGYLPGQSSPPGELRFTPTVPGGTAAIAAGEEAPLQPGLNFCSNSAKLGEATIKTPLLPAGQFLEGAVYLATQNENPFGSLIAMYIVAEDPVSGTVVKLPGVVHLTETGRIVATFDNNPQLPFEDAELHFFGGERAPLASPPRCGAYTTNAEFTPWSGSEPANATAAFNITSGPHGGPCPGPSLPFSPSLTAGTTNINAGAFSPLTTTIGREDGQQDMQSVQLHMPSGLAGLLAGVKLCPEAQANAGACSPESQIGETTVSAGVGSDPVSVTGGRVYITEKYAGAPFGLSIVNPVKAGPFDLEHDTSNPNQNPACDCVVVRAKIEVDPTTAALTITTDPLGPHAIPHLIDGIPVQIKKVNVLINRSGFTFNPTNCGSFAVTGSIASDEGASSPIGVPFQVANCATLGFKPTFKVATSGKTSKANGASLNVKLLYPKAPFGSQANIASVKVDLPKQLPSRLTTLQKACTAAQFNANPAGCPAASLIGHATATTPLLPVALTGPAYFVSHGGEAFPSLIVVLQGYGVTLDLVGTTFISKAGITSSTFKTVPDAPVGSFELSLPEGKYSALAANGNLCESKLAMPTEFVAQNGAKLDQSTPVEVQGCSNTLAITAHSIKRTTATLAIYVPAPGTIKISGKGLGSKSITAKGRETVTVRLAQKKTGRLKTKALATYTPSTGKDRKKQSKSVTLLFKK